MSNYKGAVPVRLSHRALLVEDRISSVENITCLKGYNQEGFSPYNFDSYRETCKHHRLDSWSNILSRRSYLYKG